MLSLRYKKVDIPFIYPFRTAHGLKTIQPTLIVELGFKGLYGYGEATEIVYYGITVDAMIELLESKRAVIENYSLIDPERFWHFLHHLFPTNNFLVCALDIAGWDLFAKLRRKKIYELWPDIYHNKVMTDYTIGIDEVPMMLQKMQDNPWPKYKVKLGSPNDLHIIETLAQNTTSTIRIDANAGWSFDDALHLLPHLEKLNIELIEQPLAMNSWEAVKELQAKTHLPIIADEDCRTTTDVAKCCAVYSGINIKLTKCGGITPARQMIDEAKEKNKLVMMGCMNESAIGTAAMAQFIGQLDYFDADGPLLHQTQLATGLDYNKGLISLSSEPGLGITTTLFAQ
jgi:L-Ala-D/L-Glu epimerase